MVIGVPSFVAIKEHLYPLSPEEMATCKYDWTKCSDNADLVHSPKWAEVQTACEMEATRQAKYGNPVWQPWYKGGTFGTFYKGDEYITSGIAVVIEPDAQFQNGFGVMVHSRVTCTYDLRAKRVTYVDISPL